MLQQPVAAMGRPGAVEPPPAPRPPDPPEPLTPLVGQCDVSTPWAGDRATSMRHGGIYVGPLPWSNSHDSLEEGERWLGVYSYSPNYQTVSFAIKVSPREGLQDLLDRIQQHAPGKQTDFCDTVTPLRPQRTAGFLHVVQYPSVIRAIGEGNAAIVIDLTCAGGKYFSTVLPKKIAYATLLEYILPMTSALHEELHLFVGCRNRPWPPQAEVTLDSGDVITVLPADDHAPAHVRAFDLCQPEAEWGPMHHFFRAEVYESICVLFRLQRYCFNSHTGTTLLDFVCERFRLDPNRIVTCVFPIEDLDVQGDHCPVLVAVQDLPPLAIPGHPTRQDCFTLCDLRPLGLKPQFIYTHVPTHHVPSLVLDFGISLPRHMQVQTLGGRQHERGCAAGT